MVEIPDIEHQKLQARLNEASRMVTVVCDSNDAITIQDFEGKILAWNRGAKLMFGYSEQEALKMTIWQLAPPDKAAEQKDFNRRIFAGEKVVSFETQRLTKDGCLLDVWLTVTKLVDDAGKVIGIASTERDITERKNLVKQLLKANRALKLISRSNQTLTRIFDEQEFLNKICKVAIETGYLSAWVGFAEDNENKNVKPVAQYGFEEGFLEKLKINWADNERGGSPTSKAIQNGNPSACRNILTDPEFASLREQAIKYGFASFLVLPLIGEGKCFGVLSIYAKESDAFNGEEIKLLTELSNDLAYGIISLRDRTKLKRVNEEIRASEENYRTLVESASDQIFMVNEELKFLSMNGAALNQLRKKLDEVIGKPVSVVFPKEISANNIKNLEKVFKTGQNSSIEEELTFGGDHVFVSSSLSPVKNIEGKTVAVLGVVRDITERKRAEEELQLSEQKFRSIFDCANDGILIADSENKTFVNGNKSICRLLGYSIDEIKKMGIMDIHPKEDIPYIIDQFEKQTRGEITVSENLPVKLKDGSVRYTDVNANLIKIGEKTYTVGLFRDITERKRAEQEMKKKLEELEIFYKAAMDREDRILELKKKIEELEKAKSQGEKNG